MLGGNASERRGLVHEGGPHPNPPPGYREREKEQTCLTEVSKPLPYRMTQRSSFLMTRSRPG